MRPGDIIIIYEDPLTEKKPEGKAKLVRRIKELGRGEVGGRILESWWVKFLEDAGNDMCFCRKILTPL